MLRANRVWAVAFLFAILLPCVALAATNAPTYTNSAGHVAGATGSVVLPYLDGACTPFHGTSAASTNATNIKNGPGVLCSIQIINTGASLGYFRMYNLATAPTCSSATGAVHSWPIPDSAGANAAGQAVIDLGAYGEAFTTGISFCVTGGGSDTDNTNTITGIYWNGSYK